MPLEDQKGNHNQDTFYEKNLFSIKGNIIMMREESFCVCMSGASCCSSPKPGISRPALFPRVTINFLHDINLITYLGLGFHIQKIKNIKTHVPQGPFKLRIPGFLEISFQRFNKRYLYFLKCFTKT